MESIQDRTRINAEQKLKLIFSFPSVKLNSYRSISNPAKHRPGVMIHLHCLGWQMPVLNNVFHVWAPINIQALGEGGLAADTCSRDSSCQPVPLAHGIRHSYTLLSAVNQKCVHTR